MGRVFSFLPTLAFYEDKRNPPFISFKALEYKFFTGGRSLVESYGSEYEYVMTDVEKEDARKREAENETLLGLDPDDPDFLSKKQQLLDEIKISQANESNKNGDRKKQIDKDSSKKTKKGEKTKKILHEIILPIQGGAIQSLANNWGGTNNVRLGLGINFKDIGASAKSMWAYTKRYMITEVINSALKDLWKMGLHSQGQAFNEYVGMAYTAPDFRSFRFSFDLYPSSKEEADMLKRIIFALKYYASPSSDVGLSISYPAMWEIEIVAPDFTNSQGSGKRLMMIYYSALRNIIVNNEVDGTVVFHEDGEPTKNHIELEFVELNYVTRELMSVEAGVMFNGKNVKTVLDGK